MKNLLFQCVLIFIFVLLFLPNTYPQAGQSAIDSLNGLLTQQDDKDKAATLRNLALAYMETAPPKALAFFDKSLSLAIQLHDFELAYKNESSKGRTYFLMADVIQAAESYKKSVAWARKTGKAALIAEGLAAVGSMNVESGQFEAGLNDYFESLEIAKQLTDSLQYFSTYVSIGLAYAYLHDEDKGLPYMQQALRYFKSQKQEKKMAFALGNMAAIEKERGNCPTAIAYLTEELGYARKLNLSEYIIFALNGLGECYYTLGQKEKSLGYFAEGLSLAKKSHHDWYMQNFLVNMAAILNDKKKYHEAEQHLIDALRIVEKSKKFDTEKTIYQTLIISAIGQGHTEKAKLYTMKALVANDSLFSQNTSNKVADLETKYKTKEKEAQLVAQKAQNFRQRTWLIGLSIGFLAFAAFAYLFYTRYRLRQKALLDAAVIREQELGLNAVIEAQEVERKRIAKDLHDGIAQELVALKLGFNKLENKLKTIAPDEAAQMENLSRQLNESCTEVRNIAHVMLPPTLEKSGLVSALEMLLRNSLQQADIQTAFEHFGLPERLEEKKELGLYRIAQELVNNILKHAHATKVLMQVYCAGNQLIMRLEDDGQSFNFEEARQGSSLGLLNILSRVRTLGGSFSSEPNVLSGTVSTIRIPI